MKRSNQKWHASKGAELNCLLAILSLPSAFPHKPHHTDNHHIHNSRTCARRRGIISGRRTSSQPTPCPPTLIIIAARLVNFSSSLHPPPPTQAHTPTHPTYTTANTITTQALP